MNIIEILRQTYFNLKANKLRSFLTILGIAWGVIAIQILLGWGFGFKDFLWTGMTKMGQNIVAVWGGRTSKDIGGYKSGRPVRLELKDVEILKSSCPLIKEITPYIHFWGSEVKRNEKFREEYIRAVRPEVKRICNWHVADGRFISPYDIENRTRVVFLGHAIKRYYFGEEKAVGKILNIRGDNFEVIGVGKTKEPQMSSMNRNDDDQILVPFSTAYVLWQGGKYIDNIWIQPYDFKKSEIVVREIRKILSRVHRFSPGDEEALGVFDMNFYYKLVDLMIIGMNILLFIIGITTLFIGSIGVMNIMLVSVQERTREIGIRKAIGARKKDIRRQFLGEALAIMFLGGFIGLFLGTAFMFLVSSLPLPPMIPIPQNSLILNLLVIGVLSVTGIFAGYIPAKNAAELLPVKALQYERGEITAGKKVPKFLWQPKSLFGDLFNEAITEIRTSKLRSFLTMFGIVWGIAAVIILLGFGRGFDIHFKMIQGKIGLERITVYPGTVKKNIGGSTVEKDVRFTVSDVEALNKSGGYIKFAEPELNLYWDPVAKYKNETRPTHMLAITPRSKILRNFDIEEGRFINKRDIDEARRVCLVGSTIRDRLFKKEKNILGKEIRIDGVNYIVVGLLEHKGTQMSVNNSLDDEKILIPYTAAFKDFWRNKYLSRIMVMPKNPQQWSKTYRQIRKVLARKHNLDENDDEAFEIYSMLDGMEMMYLMSLGLKIFLGGVAVISLLVGGIGIMNVMLFIVTQRTREIGILRAIGAKRKHVFFQFLLETLLITVLAGFIGFLIGYGTNYLMNQMPLPEFFFPPISSLGISIFTMSVLMITGFLSGLIPALRAMRLNVIDALRYE